MEKLKHKTILLIEGDDSESSKIKSWIDKINANTTVYRIKDCKLGLDLLNGNSPGHRKILPDIILVNIYAPVMDGLEFLGIIKNYASFRSIKVYFLVPGTEGDNSTVSSQFQIEGMLSKPFELNFEGRESLSMRKLNADLVGSRSLKLSSFIMIPGLLNAFFGKIRQDVSAIADAIRQTRHIALLKTTALVTALAGMVIITAAQSHAHKQKTSYAPLQAIAVKPGLFMRNAPVAVKAQRSLIQTGGLVSPAINREPQKKPVYEKPLAVSLPVMPVDSPKIKDKTLRIVVVEENGNENQSGVAY